MGATTTDNEGGDQRDDGSAAGAAVERDEQIAAGDPSSSFENDDVDRAIVPATAANAAATRSAPNATNAVVAKKRDHRQWISDRVAGKSKVGNDHPPARCCTVPPCVACCPGILEQNCVCETIGRIGVVRPQHDKCARKWLMRIGFVTQVTGMILTAISCFAISENYSILSSLGFTRGIITGGPRNMTEDIGVSIGLRAIAVNNPNPGRIGQVVVTFDEFCTLTPSSQNAYSSSGPQFDAAALQTYLNPRDCGECAAVSGSMVASLIVSVVTYIPTISTDVLRMYPNYDVNCQKAFGFIVAIFGLLMAINTWLQYDKYCVSNFYQGLVPHDDRGQVMMEAQARAPGTYSEGGGGWTSAVAGFFDIVWHEGPGLICLMTATFLKIVDIVCHMLLPTPSITRNYEEQAEYEKLSTKEDGEDKLKEEAPAIEYDA